MTAAQIDNPGASIPILSEIDADTFYRDFIRENKPCLIRGAASDWTAVQCWHDDEYLRQLMKHRHLPLTTSVRKDTGFDHQSPMEDVRFTDFLSNYRDRPESYLNDCAMPGILVQDIGPHPTLVAFKGLDDYHRFTSMFLGGGGQLAPLHYDDEDNLYALIFGEKEFFLHDICDFDCMYPHDTEHAPDFSQIDLDDIDHDRFPRYKDSICYKAILHPGDILYVPAYWWHSVRSPIRSFAVSWVRLDRESQYQVFMKLLNNDVLPITSAQKDAMLARDTQPDITETELTESSLSTDCLFFLYLALASLYVHRKHRGDDLAPVKTAFLEVRPAVLDVLKQHRYRPPVQYLLENFFRCGSGQFKF